jgi:outer membrane lipoprotein-sorting protein
MINRLGRALVFVVLLSLAANVGSAGEKPSSNAQKADDIIKKHVQAIGGLEKIKAIKTLRIGGHLEQQGVELPITISLKRPNRSRMQVDLIGRMIVQGYDGKTAWWVNPLLGIFEPTEMPEEFAAPMRRWTDFEGPLVDYDKKGHIAEYEGEKATDSGTLHKIKLTLSDGDVWHVYIDPKTYLEVKRIFPQTYGGETKQMTTWFRDYATVDGVRIFRIIQGDGVDGTPYTLTFDAFEANVKIDDMQFEKP